MALSEKAQNRKNEVGTWLRDQINSKYRYDVNSQRRRITEAREYMIGGLALSAEYGGSITGENIPDTHVFEDDAHWKIVEREMKIRSAVFYSHLDISGWEGIPNHEPVTTHFYRSKIEKGAVMATIAPELVEGFPTFPASAIAKGSLQGDYPKQAVLDWLGYISLGHGNADEEASGELGLSNDTTMRKLTFFQDDAEIELLVPHFGNNFHYFQRNRNSYSYAFGIITPTDEKARVILGNSPIPISPSSSQGTLSWTIVAEDDTERHLEIQISQI